MGVLGDLIKRHMKLGYSRFLLAFDSVFILIIVIDLIRYSRDGLSLRATFLSIDWAPSVRQILVFVLFQLIVLPGVIAIARIVSRGRWISGIPRADHPLPVAVIHFVVTLTCMMFFVVSARMEQLSGWSELGGAYYYGFQSHFSSLVRSRLFDSLLTAIGSAFGVLVSTIFTFVLVGKEPSRALGQYSLRAQLADLPADLYPLESTAIMTMQAIGGPPIQRIRKKANTFLAKSVPLGLNSHESVELLDAAFARCRARIVTSFISPANDELQVDLYTGTDRAMEAALIGCGDIDALVISPFVSPRVARTVGDISLLRNCRMVTLELSREQFAASWAVQQDALIEQLRARVSGAKKVALVLSEVDYATGLRIPLDEHIRVLRQVLVLDTKLITVIDGTNAVGNGRLLYLGPDVEFYVFAPHRWLIAAEPCGLLVSRAPGLRGAAGRWIQGERKTVSQVRAIAGLSAALEVLEERGFSYFSDRCVKLKRELILNLPKSLRVIGVTSGLETTFVIACAPGPGAEWKLNVLDLEKELSRRSRYASVLSIYPNLPLVRIAIPYFADVRELNILAQFLDNVITS
jgi:hypothetical protein